MGQKYALQGASFINPAFRKLYDDKGLTEGSLAMLDLTHSLAAFSGVPGAGASIYNIAWNQAKAILGAGDAASLAWSFANSQAPTSALFERTAKGALHGLVSQVAKSGATNFIPPLAVRDYLRVNSTRNYAVFFWYQITRVSSSTPNMKEYGVHSVTSAASNLLFQGNFSNSLTGAPQRSSLNRPTGWSGTVASSDVNLVAQIPSWGNVSGFTGLNTTGSKSYVLYRTHIVDVLLSGMTFAELEAADLALFTELFAAGGRLHGDSWELEPSDLA
ncbi:MAG: hypothetical protein WAS21_28700 [Geminicoccaceae bacterium]